MTDWFTNVLFLLCTFDVKFTSFAGSKTHSLGISFPHGMKKESRTVTFDNGLIFCFHIFHYYRNHLFRSHFFKFYMTNHLLILQLFTIVLTKYC